MFNRDNAIGILLLGFCVVLAAIMLRYIAIGETPRFNLSQPWSGILGIVFAGLVLYGLRGSIMRRLRGDQSGPHWPDPRTGRKSLWDRLRGR
jgi:heme A synthase